ncbi:MAG TPA: UDP-N-acetylmuramoyl-L-alanyl-D-glutamate--2,6-diaminopimelate ligase [Candidatus Binatia bacterium]
MKLRDFVALQRVEETQGDLEREVSGLTYDSRKAAVGHVFFALPGEKVDGHQFIPEAIRRGAAAVVYERVDARPQGTTSIRVANARTAMGLWAARFFRGPSDRLKLIGVTGTNGKTTLTYLLESIFAAAGSASGVIGTINYRYTGREFPSHHTTPESLDLEALLADMTAAGVQAVAMEVSSHALAQERVRGLDFDAAVFTNLSRDHLDYHHDMDDYFAAKSKLFTDHLKNSSKPKRAAIVNGADDYGAKLLRLLDGSEIDTWSYGRDDRSDVRPVSVQSDVQGLRGSIQVKNERVKFSSPLIGNANLENILGAAAAGFALGFPKEAVLRGIEQLNTVPGRLEKVKNDLGISILVDYAHTPDALEKVIAAVRPLTTQRVITVFGCGGDRDRGKRPLMGEIAARLSDMAVVTSDNPRTEEPLAIIKEIEAGVEKTGLPKLVAAGESPSEQSKIQKRKSKMEERGYLVEPDRREAIRLALQTARSGDVVLIAGKGHEDYQILGATRIHFDDREVAREESARRADGSI